MKQLDKIRGTLIGGAAGGALGYPIEFIDSFEAIKSHYDDSGITRFLCKAIAERWGLDISRPKFPDYGRYLHNL